MATLDGGMRQRLNLSQVQSKFTPQQVAGLDAMSQGIRQVPVGSFLLTSTAPQTLAAGWNRLTLDWVVENEGSTVDLVSLVFRPNPDEKWRLSAGVGLDGAGVTLNDFQAICLFTPDVLPTALGVASSLQAASIVLYAAEVGATRAAHLHGTCDYIQTGTSAGLIPWAWAANGTSEVTHAGQGHTWFSGERIR